MHLTVGCLATSTVEGEAFAAALPDSPDIESPVADGTTLESALTKLCWEDWDLLVVGSSRFASPRRIFLGSTGARILAGTDGPVAVIPGAGEPGTDEYPLVR